MCKIRINKSKTVQTYKDTHVQKWVAGIKIIPFSILETFSELISLANL